MRIALCILTISVFCLPGPAVSSVSFVLSSDEAGTNCSVADTEPGIVNVHMVVTDTGGISALQFAAPAPDCWTGATWLADNLAFLVAIGDTQHTWDSGLSIGLGGCQEPPVYIGYMVFSTNGTSSPCCEYPIIKAIDDGHPEIPGPIMVDCAMTHVETLGTQAITINVGSDCSCAQRVANHSTTWGGVKEMFK